MVEEGVKVGLGTDVSGGYSPSMLVALRHAIIASQMVEMNDNAVAQIEFAKENVEIRIESLKIELDKYKEVFIHRLDKVKQDFERYNKILN